MPLSFFAGIGFGILWNLANVWCLKRLLGCWTGDNPSWKKAAVWAMVKFPALYATAYFVLRDGTVSLLGFSLGFTVVLIATCATLVARGRRFLMTRV